MHAYTSNALSSQCTRTQAMHCEAVAHYRCNLSNQTANKSGSTGAWGVNQRRIAGYECPKSEDGVVLSVTAIWQVAPHRLSVSTNQPMVRKRLADQLVSQTGHHCLTRPLHIPVSSPLLFWLLETAPHHLVMWLLGKPYSLQG